MRKYSFHIGAITTVVAIIAISALITLAGTNERTSGNKVQVLEAVAPAYPMLAVASNTSGRVVVEARINAAGEVTSVKVIEGHRLLRPIAEGTAHRWRFNPSVRDAGIRTAVLTFTFNIMPKETRDDELTPVFKPPYQVEIRHKPFKPIVESDPPSYVRPSGK
jgi:TonB family protein